MGPSIAITVEYGYDLQHHQQLFAGIARLARLGVLRARWRYVPPIDHSMRILVDNGPVIGFDTTDSSQIIEGLYSSSDIYFKRSLSQADYVSRTKTVPLGLNYLVHDDVLDFAHWQRAIRSPMTLPNRLRTFAVALAVDRLLPRRCFQQERVRTMWAMPSIAAQGSDVRVGFTARLWDPGELANERERDERSQINRTRIECACRLKREFGPRFIGGIVQDDFSGRLAPGIVVPASSTNKQRYLESLRSADIAVATTGLHGSIGWKFAEYVAFSRAIVTEPLLAVLPGHFGPERNYLVFEGADECVSAAVRLVEDRTLRQSMMLENATYYWDFILPERIVLRALFAAFGVSSTVYECLFDRVPARGVRA